MHVVYQEKEKRNVGVCGWWGKALRFLSLQTRKSNTVLNDMQTEIGSNICTLFLSALMHRIHSCLCDSSSLLNNWRKSKVTWNLWESTEENSRDNFRFQFISICEMRYRKGKRNNCIDIGDESKSGIDDSDLHTVEYIISIRECLHLPDFAGDEISYLSPFSPALARLPLFYSSWFH